MKIAIIDADLIGRKRHRFPNIVCMKLSSHYKSKGAEVELKLDYDNIEMYDHVYISKVFTNTPVPIDKLSLSNVQYGGTGFFYDKAPRLPYEIEHCIPDYHLYDNFVQQQLSLGVSEKNLQYYTKFSIGFATRGCFRKCSFCVNKNYSKSERCGSVAEWIDDDRPYICCLDDNILACSEWRSIFKELQQTGKRFQFKQGCDERILTEEKCKELFINSKWIGDYIFAFDNIQDSKIIQEKLRMIRGYTDQACKFYVFCAYNHTTPEKYDDDFWVEDIRDLFCRIAILLKYGCLPYVMRYEDFTLSPYRGMYINIARWCNQVSFIKKKTFAEFCNANGEKSATYRYYSNFLSDHPDFSEYCNIRYEKGVMSNE